MKKKLILELFLFLLIITISILIFNYYFKDNEKKIVFDKTKIKDNDDRPLLNSETASIIKNIDYSFVDENNNNYKIFAEYGKIDTENPDIIKMTNVKAYAYLENNEPIKIESKFANYNKNSHNTKFFEEVTLMYLNHNANSENLDLEFLKNTISMYNKLIYKNGNIRLQADKLLFNLKTKNAKIFMDESSKKVKVVKY